MPKFLAPIDLVQNEIQNATVQNLGSAPSTPHKGQIYYNTGTDRAYINTGTSGSPVWTDITTAAGGLNAFANFTDGTNTQSATSTGDTFTLTGTSALTVVVGATKKATFTVVPSGIPHSGLGGLTSGDDHTQYAFLAGRSGGQTYKGGTGSSDSLTLLATSNGTNSGSVAINTALSVSTTAVTVTDAVNFAVGTSTGTKIGTSTSQKLGFFNATPVIQPASGTDLITALSNLGFVVSASTPLNLQGGTLTSPTHTYAGNMTVAPGTETSGTGYNLTVAGGVDNASSLGSGGNIYVKGGNAIGSGGIGGLVQIQGGTGTSLGGSVSICDSVGNIKFYATAAGISFFSSGAAAQASATADLKQALYSYGLIAGSSSATPLNLTGGILTAGKASNVTYTDTTTSGSIVGFKILPTYNQATATTANTDFLINRVETAVGSGAQLFVDFQVGGTSKFNISDTGTETHADGANIIFGTSTGTQIGTSTSQKIGFFGVTPVVQQSQTTDLQVALQNLGLVGSGSSAYNLNLHGGTLTAGTISGSGTSLTGVALLASSNTFTASGQTISYTNTASSGTVNAIAITPTYNQTSTAGATDFLINRTQTAVGSGSQLFADFQVAGTSKFNVNNAGTVTLADAANLIVGTSTGTQIGTSTSQKLGFFGATPVVQQTSTTDLRVALINLGLYATGGASPLDLNGGTLKTPTITYAGAMTYGPGSNASAGYAVTITGGTTSGTTSVVGGQIYINGGTSGGTGTTGGHINITGGTSNASGVANGGNVNITGGPGNATTLGKGGNIYITSGSATGSAGATAGGVVQINSQSINGLVVGNSGIGFFSTTDVVQQSGEIAAALVNYGLMSSATALTVTGTLTGGSVTVSSGGTLTLTDGVNVVLGTSTGTKIGTSTSQKLGFFNATPVVQPTSGTDLITALSNLGLVVSASTPLNLQGGTLTTPNITSTAALTVAPASSAAGYPISITGGTATSNSAVAGNISIVGGTASGTTSTGGSINLKGGAGSSTNGSVSLQNSGGTNQIQVNSTGIGFFNVTPVAQPTSTTDLRTALINLGLYASGGASPLNLNGGSLTALTGTFSQTTGTAPLTISSTTLVSNLNVQYHNGAQASATPTASYIPIANGSNKLASGWISQVLATTDLTDVTSHTGTGTVAVFQASPNLTTPTIGDFSNANHNHTNTAGGGTLTHAAISDFDTQVRTSRLDQMAVPTASVNLNSQKITNLLDPTSAQDAATKNYVDAASQGLNIKASVRVATVGTETFTISSGSVTQISGTAIDGVSPSVGDRILIKDAPSATGVGSANSTQPGNGVYTVTSNTTNLSVSRSADFTGTTNLPAGSFTFVEGGTVNGSAGFVVSTPSTNSGFTYGTNNVAWTQFSGAGEITAGNGLSKSGNTLTVVGTSNRISVSSSGVDISAAYVGQSSITTLGTIGTGTWQGTAVGTLYGGTGATSISSARTNLSSTSFPLPQKYAANIGDGSTTSIVVTHNLGTQDVMIAIRDNTSPYAYYFPTWQATDTNNITVVFTVAPTTNQYRVVVMG